MHPYRLLIASLILATGIITAAIIMRPHRYSVISHGSVLILSDSREGTQSVCVIRVEEGDRVVACW
jgi:hypothetical protein